MREGRPVSSLSFEEHSKYSRPVQTGTDLCVSLHTQNVKYRQVNITNSWVKLHSKKTKQKKVYYKKVHSKTH